MANKKFFVDVDLQGNTINNLKADTLDITSNLASANTKRIVYWSGQYYYSNGTTWIALGATGTLPTGGVTGDILAKASGADYDVEWISNYTSTVQHEVKLAESINIGQAVYVSSANGTNMLVSKASNASEATSSKTLGLLAFTGVTNDIGFVITEGLLAGLDTSTATAGDPVWLGTNGNLIFGLANKPVAPAHLVFIGIVTRVQSVNGEIFVKVQNGFELGELHNVDALNPNNNDGLFYNSSNSLWEHKSIATALGYTPENVANKSTDVLLGTSDTLYPTQNAVKVYTDNILGNSNALVYKGTIDCSTNPDYPTADAGWMYIASVAGKIGGASGTDVEVGDMIICNTDGTVSGNQATVGQYWNVIQKNIVGAVTGPASSINNTIPVFDGVTGKVIKQGIITDNGTNIGIGTSSPTTKLHVVGDFMVDYAGVTPLRVNNTLVTSGDTTGVTGIYLGDAGSGVNMIQREKHTANSAGINLYAEYGYNTQSLVAKFQYNLAKIFVGAIQRFHITGNGDIGIGNNITPSAKLHVNNTTAANSFLVEDDTNPDASPFVIDNAGNVGIGTLTPTAPLHVNVIASPSTGETLANFTVSDDPTSNLKILNNTGTDAVFIPNIFSTGSHTSQALRITANTLNDTGTTPIMTFDARKNNSSEVSTRPLFSWTNYGTDKMIMNSLGYLGIGKAPEHMLDVLGTIRVGNTSTYASTINQANIASITSEFIPVTGPSYVRFRGHTGSAGNVHVMSIGGHGRIGINIQAPTATLHVTNTGATDSFLIEDETNPDSTPFVINNAGSVGIGTLTPATKLDVNGDVTISTIANATTDTDKFLVSDSGVIKYRTGSEILSDIAAQGALTVTTTGSSGAATLVGNTLNIPVYNGSLIPNLNGTEIWRGSTFRNNSTTIDTTAGITLATSGTNTARSVGTTSYATRAIRMGVTASVTSTGRYSGMRGSALLWYVTGGFLYSGEFNISDTATATGTHNFWGLASSTSDLVIGDVGNNQPSALTNIIAFANDSGDGNLQIMHNDASGTATKTDLGSSFPSNRTAGAAITTIYSCFLYNAPNSSEVIYRIVNKETGAVAQGTLSSNLPASTVGLNFFGVRTMGTSGGGINNSGQFDVYRLGVYSL